MVVLVALFGVRSAVVAQDAPGDEKWQSSWTGYLWVPGMNGDVNVRGIPADVNVSVSDTANQIKNMKASFSGHYEGNKKPYGIIADVNYWKLDLDYIGVNNAGNVEPSQIIVELAGTYTLSEKIEGEQTAQRVQALLGARYNQLKLQINNTALDEGGTSFSGSRSQNFVDPFIGVRMYQALSPKWGFNLRTDIGGFGVGSEMVYNAVASFGYNVGKKRSILMGWKYYKTNFNNGSGDDYFKWNVAESGPFVAFQTRF